MKTSSEKLEQYLPINPQHTPNNYVALKKSTIVFHEEKNMFSIRNIALVSSLQRKLKYFRKLKLKKAPSSRTTKSPYNDKLACHDKVPRKTLLQMMYSFEIKNNLIC